MAVVPAGGQSEDVQRLRAALLATLAEARGRAGEAEAAQPVSAHEVQTEARDAFPPDSQSEDSGHRVPPDAPAQSGMVTSTAQTDQSAPGKVKRGHEVGTAARVFVGREAEMKMLRVTLDDVIDGHGCVVLVGGAPGVGKTALAEQLANHAAARRARVLWGRCTQDDGAPAFWPWVQVVRAYIHDWEPDELRALLGSRAPDIAVAVPDLEIWGSDPSARVTTEAEDARVRMFDGLAGFLRDGSQRQPLVVVLEDLQWADHTSLRFLQRLATEIRASRLLIVGTFRDLEAGHEQALSTTLAELSSSAAAKRLLLRGLSEPDVERFIARTASIVPPASLVSALWRESDGNPFFLGEIVRWLSEEGQLQGATEVSAWSFPIPQGVRAVIGSRLGKLSDDCNQVLALAAVIGQEFGLGLLQAVAAREMAPLPADRLLEVLDTAEAAQLVALRADNTEQYCFAHALIRETLYEELGAQRRVRLHRQVTAALEELHGSGSDSSLAALAHHALRGAHGGGDVDKAIDYASRAAAEASARLAFEAAVTHHRQALQALGLKTPAKADPARRCDLLLALALAHSSAGHVGRARTAMLDAVPFARQSGDARRLAKAVIGIWKIGMEVGTYGSLDEEALALVDEALQAIGSADEVLRVRLLIIRARIFNRALLPDLIERARPLCREAVAVARRVGDREALLEALSLLYLAIETPDNLPERRALIAECIDLAAANHDPNGLVVAYDYRVNFSLEVGDRAALDAAIAAVARIAQEVPRPLFRMYALAHQAVVAQAAGRSHDEERYADQLLALGRGAAGPIARVLYATRALMMRYEQGRLEDSEMIWRALVAQAPDVPTGRVILTWMLASTGRIEEARQEFERLAALDFTVAWDVSWLLNHALLAMVCDTLGDSARAVLLYGRLLPYAESCVWAGGPIWLGSVSLFLGLLARTQLRWEDAERHFEQAIEVNTRIGLRPWLARAQYEYAAMLLARQSADDRTTATALLRQALATAREISMTALLEQGLALKQRADLSEDGTADTPRPGVEDAVVQMPPSATPAVFRLAGDYWTIAYDGLVIRLRDTKGLQYLAHLLRHPGQELLAIDLVAGIAGDADRDQYVAVCADPLAAAMPDATARLQYKERMAELRDELAEAERNNDLGRAARAREEMEHIAEQLALACGLGGRRRVGGIAGERARQAVTKAIRSAIDKIGRSHPALARHLTRTVKTGYYCAYALDPESGVAWDL
jgi:predicted ATPase